VRPVFTIAPSRPGCRAERAAGKLILSSRVVKLSPVGERRRICDAHRRVGDVTEDSAVQRAHRIRVLRARLEFEDRFARFDRCGRNPTSFATGAPTSPTLMRSMSRATTSDRMPDGLQFEERGDLVWTLASGRRGRSASRSPRPGAPAPRCRRSAPVTSSASTSMCERDRGRELARSPVMMFHDTRWDIRGRETLRELDRHERVWLRGDHHRGVAADDDGREARHQTEERRLRREDPVTPVGSGMVKLKYGPATGLAEPNDLRELVGPSRVPHHTIDGPSDSSAPPQSSASSAWRASIISATR